VLAGLPVAILLAVQISSLRYQSEKVTVTQQICIAFYLLLLVWFFSRQRQRGNEPGTGSLDWARYPAPLLLMLAVLILDWVYLKVPSAEEWTVRAGDDGPLWTESYRQPLDMFLCPWASWGCRYLSVGHRTLVGHVWRPEAIVDLRAEEEQITENSLKDTQKTLAAIEGIYLRGRTLRFAKFDESHLYAADFGGADLSGATLSEAQLQGADMDGALLRSASLQGANLRAASLEGVSFEGAYLTGASLRDASLVDASLEGADLRVADLRGANLGPPRPDASPKVKPARVTQEQINTACCDSKTKLPPGLEIHICAPAPPYP
jgi:hypothetical protein